MTTPESIAPKPDLTGLREELEATRRAYHELLDAIPSAAWNCRAVNSAWTVKQEMWHITWGARFMLDLVKNARRGIGLPRPPMAIADPLNALYSRVRATFATRQSIGRRYDRTHQAILSELSAISQEEWAIQVSIFGEKHDLHYLLHGISHHLEEHAARVRPVLSQPASSAD